jgi:alpha-amylase
MKPIKKLAEIRKRNGITATSSVNILAAENDLYMAKINNKIIVKVGHKLDLGNLPLNAEIAATSGQDHALWEIK